MKVEEIIDIIDNHLISTGRHFIGLRSANDLLISKGKTDINLKSILEKNEIPHAYQTETKPRQWRIPYSDETTFKERRREFLKTQSKAIPTNNNNTNNNNSLTFKHFIILVIAGFVIYFLFFDNSTKNNSSSIDDSEYYINTQSLTTYNKSDFDEMYNCVTHNDTKALQEMVDLGKIYILEEGTEVYVVDVGFGYDVVRQKGSTKKLWIATERLSKH